LTSSEAVREGARTQEWVFGADDVALLLASENLPAAAASPFHSLARGPNRSPLPLQVPPPLREALTRLSAPDVVLGLATWAPGLCRSRHFYRAAGDAGFAECNQAVSGHFEIAWPRMPDEIAAAAESAVFPGHPLLPEAFGLPLNADEFAALLAIADVVREDGMVSALHRLPPPRSTFDSAAVFECWERGARGADFGWLARRASLISPITSAPIESTLATGLRSLASERWLETNGARYSPSPRLARLLSEWSASDGLCTISTRMRISPAGRWERKHLAVLAAPRSLWRLDFTIEGTGFRVMARMACTADLLDWLEPAIHGSSAKGFAPPPPPPPKSSPPSAPEPPKPAPRTCTRCGALLRERAAFCTQCRTPVDGAPTRRT
jgi:hypothetical protein